MSTCIIACTVMLYEGAVYTVVASWINGIDGNNSNLHQVHTIHSSDDNNQPETHLALTAVDRLAFFVSIILLRTNLSVFDARIIMCGHCSVG